MEAPKEIFVGHDNPERLSVVWWRWKRKDCDIEYIRKDIYDKTTENLQAELKELRLELDNAVINSQSRIKELEGAIKNSLRCGWHSMEGSIDGTFDDLTEQEIRQFRKDAKNALAQESEG